MPAAEWMWMWMWIVFMQTREEDKALRAELKRGHKLGAAVEDAVYHIEDTFMFGQQIMLLNAKLESVRDLAPLDDHVDLRCVARGPWPVTRDP
jgi:hypothetical protein